MPRSKFSRADVTFRELLKEWRQQADITQAELAKKLDQPQSYVSKYETGERRLDFAETAIVCDALGTDIQEFAAAFSERLRTRRK